MKKILPLVIELSSLRSQFIGMMECWKNGIMGLEDWGNGGLG